MCFDTRGRWEDSLLRSPCTSPSAGICIYMYMYIYVYSFRAVCRVNMGETRA